MACLLVVVLESLTPIETPQVRISRLLRLAFSDSLMQIATYYRSIKLRVIIFSWALEERDEDGKWYEEGMLEIWRRLLLSGICSNHQYTDCMQTAFHCVGHARLILEFTGKLFNWLDEVFKLKIMLGGSDLYNQCFSWMTFNHLNCTDISIIWVRTLSPKNKSTHV